jgi:hypothetical protein
MSKGTCEQIAGRIIGINFEEQAIDIRPIEGFPVKRILKEPVRFYANEPLFRDLVKRTKSYWSKFQECTEGHFEVRGRILLDFDPPSGLDIARALAAGGTKYPLENPK